MGQSKVDLPDPTPASSVGATGSADDLLSQLASEDIDRLLAEAEAELPAKLREARTLESQMEKTQVASAAPPVVEREAAPDQGDELNQLLDTLTRDEPTAAAPPSVVPAKQEDELDRLLAAESEALLDQQAADVEQNDQDRSAGERAALIESPAQAVAATATEPLADDPSEGRLPIWLQVLEWFSAPLNACSDSMRDAIGKVAIMTTINAVALLVYVFFVRHR